MAGRRIKARNTGLQGTICCPNNFDTKITFQTKRIAGNNNPNTSATVAFTDLTSVWAMVKSTPTMQWVDGVQTANTINTDFYVRYDSALDNDNKMWIELYGDKYRIVSVDPNIDNAFELMRFRCVKQGDENINANLT